MFKNFLIKVLRRTINKLETEIKSLKEKIKEQNHNCLILLNTNKEQRKEIKELKEKVELLEDKNQDLENNVEFLVNNLTQKKRASLGLDNQN